MPKQATSPATGPLAGVLVLDLTRFYSGPFATLLLAGYGAEVQLPEGFSAVDSALLTDPQTSGGLLVSCDANAVNDVLAVFRRHGFAAAAEIGEIVAESAGGSRLLLR